MARCKMQFKLLFKLLLSYTFCYSISAETTSLSLINFTPEALEIFWLDDAANYEVKVKDLLGYSEAQMHGEVGHSFVYYYLGERHAVTLHENSNKSSLHLIGGETTKRVECSTSAGDLRITVHPDWSPRGACRFLELIHVQYFDGCALNRVVPAFLTQFGIGADYAMRTHYRMDTIPDDEPRGISFKPGYMSYAGSGPDSRSNEVFIVMPDADDWTLSNFGSSNPWETPFGFVEEETLTTVGNFEAYGDMPPWGTGPRPELIYEEDGYQYLEKHFPRLSYIHECRIVVQDEVEKEL
jgi:peptidyl-prolyl cis-trans isomerase A (cyclophilin A)